VIVQKRPGLRTAVICSVVVVALGCGTEPTETGEYAALLDSLESAEAGLASSETELAASTALAEQLQDDLEAVETALGDAQADIDELRLRYGDQIRADLQAGYDDEVESACDQAGQNPTRDVDSFVSYDTDWDHLEFDEDQLIVDVTECAAPAREASQMTRQDAVAALEPVAALVMDAIRSDDHPDDLEDQIRSIVGGITNNAVYEDRSADWVEALERLETGHYCSNRGCTVISLLDELMEFGDVPGLPAASMFGGSRPVGDGDDEALPGTWVTYQVDGCYWERLDDRGEIIDNNFASSAPQVQVAISSTDFAFNSSGCGRWLRK
jgi:hypothetical protein